MVILLSPNDPLACMHRKNCRRPGTFTVVNYSFCSVSTVFLCFSVLKLFKYSDPTIHDLSYVDSC